MRKQQRESMCEPLESRALLANIVVNTPVDVVFPSTTGLISLRQALNSANVATSPTTITFDQSVFTSARTIFLNSSLLTISGQQPVTIVAPDSGVTLDGRDLVGALRISSPAAVSLSRVSIANPGPNTCIEYIPTTADGTLSMEQASIESSVGALLVMRGSASLSDIAVEGTPIFAESASAITNYYGSVELTRVSIDGCYSRGSGGGIYNQGNLVLRDVMLTNNTAKVEGGAILNIGVADLRNVSVIGNSCEQGDGGGISSVLSSSTLVMQNCLVASNTASTSGGGIKMLNGSLVNVTVANNSARYGGGAYLDQVVITNCTISGNRSIGDGFGGGAILVGSTLANSLIAGNSTEGLSPDVRGGVLSWGNNFVGIGDGCTGFNASDLVGSVSTPKNALLGPLNDNGGPSHTFLPQTGSPVIDSGQNGLIPTDITSDQRGLPRISNGKVDIGAVEVQIPSLVLDLVASSDSGLSSTDNVTNESILLFEVLQADASSTIELLRDGTVVDVRVGPGVLRDDTSPEGQHVYRARQIVSTLVTGASLPINVTVDRTAPTAPGAPDLLPQSDTGISNADNITKTTDLLVEVVSPENVFRLSVNGVELEPSYQFGALASINLLHGTYSIKARSADVAGNVSVLGPGLVVSVDTVAPNVIASEFTFEVGHSLLYQFDTDLVGPVTSSNVSVLNTATGESTAVQVYWSSPNAIVTFVGVVNGLLRRGEYRATFNAQGMTDVAGNVSASTNHLNFFVLDGDATRDRLVDFDDLLRLSQNYGRINAVYSQGDFNYDGRINFSDLLLLTQAYGDRLLVASSLSTSRNPVRAASVGKREHWLCPDLVALT